MPQFVYVAKDPTGKTVDGTLEYESVTSLIEALRSRGLTIVSVNEQGKGSSKLAFKFFAKSVNLDDIVIFTRMLATMVDSGIPLIQGLEILQEQVDNPRLRTVIGQMRGEVEKGASFSSALSHHKKVFSALYISMVKAGESSGTLDEILDRLAAYLEKMSNLIKKVKSSLVYPALVSIIAFAVVVFMFIVVIPVFKGIYESFDATLPAPTAILLAISDFIVQNIIWLSIAFVTGVYLFVRYIKTKQGKRWFDRLKLRVIVFGPLFRKLAVTKFTRTLSTLVRSGVPILQSLEIVASTSGNTEIESAVLSVKSKIKEGEGLARPLRETRVFPPMVVRMIAVGEETGELEKMLSKISDFYDAQVDAAISALTSIIEPIIIAFLGVVIGGIVVCMYLPIFSLWQVVAG